jgi:hypothetical protein
MQAAGSVIPEILAELLRTAPKAEVARLVWPVVCGARVAAQTVPRELHDGVLRVQVPDRTWCAEMSGLEAQYRREFARLLGPKAVRQIVFVER